MKTVTLNTSYLLMPWTHGGGGDCLHHVDFSRSSHVLLPGPPSCDHTTWPHHIITPCAMWRLSHCLHLDRGVGRRGGGMWGEYACVRSSYTSAHAQCHHGNKHLPTEAGILSFFWLFVILRGLFLQDDSQTYKTSKEKTCQTISSRIMQICFSCFQHVSEHLLKVK